MTGRVAKIFQVQRAGKMRNGPDVLCENHPKTAG